MIVCSNLPPEKVYNNENIHLYLNARFHVYELKWTAGVGAPSERSSTQAKRYLWKLLIILDLNLKS